MNNFQDKNIIFQFKYLPTFLFHLSEV